MAPVSPKDLHPCSVRYHISRVESLLNLSLSLSLCDEHMIRDLSERRILMEFNGISRSESPLFWTCDSYILFYYTALEVICCLLFSFDIHLVIEINHPSNVMWNECFLENERRRKRSKAR